MIKCCSTFNLLIIRIVKMKAGELFAILSVPQIRQRCDCRYYVRNRSRIWKSDWKIWLWKQSNWFKSYQTMLLFTLREKIIQKWKYAEKCTRFLTLRDDSRRRWGSFFIWTDLEKFFSCLQMDSLQRMGAVGMRVQTADKNINNPQ